MVSTLGLTRSNGSVSHAGNSTTSSGGMNWHRSSYSWPASLPVGQATSSGRRPPSWLSAAMATGRAASDTAMTACGSPKACVSPGSARSSGGSDDNDMGGSAYRALSLGHRRRRSRRCRSCHPATGLDPVESGHGSAGRCARLGAMSASLHARSLRADPRTHRRARRRRPAGRARPAHRPGRAERGRQVDAAARAGGADQPSTPGTISAGAPGRHRRLPAAGARAAAPTRRWLSSWLAAPASPQRDAALNAATGRPGQRANRAPTTGTPMRSIVGSRSVRPTSSRASAAACAELGSAGAGARPADDDAVGWRGGAGRPGGVAARTVRRLPARRADQRPRPRRPRSPRAVGASSSRPAW